MARAGRDEPSVRSESGHAEQRCRVIIALHPASPATSARGVRLSAFRRRGRAVRDRDPCGARAGRRLRARAPHRHGTLSADPRFGRVLPSLPRPSRGLVRATPGSPDALPGRGRNRLPRHDERAERACRSGPWCRSSSCSPSTPSKNWSRCWSHPKGELLFLQRKEGYVALPPITPPAVERCSSVSVKRRGHDDAGAQRALARRRCGQHRRHRGQARWRAGARRVRPPSCAACRPSA